MFTREPPIQLDAPGSRMARAVAILLLGWAVLQAVRLALGSSFTLDEFQYAHAAWEISVGRVPYRDFFEVHGPLVYQALAPTFWFTGADPAAIFWLRAGMLSFALLAGIAGWALADREGAGWLAPVLMVALLPCAEFMVQIRPDAAGASLLVAALAAASHRRLRPLVRSSTSGVLLILSAWATQKSVATFPVFLLALAHDASRRDHTKRLMGDPRGFVLGAGLTGLALLAWLLLTGAAAPAWHWTVEWAADHQRNYPGFHYSRHLLPVVYGWPWVFALAGVGVAAIMVRLRRHGPCDTDLLLLGCLATTFASFALQRAPFPYSLSPFLTLVAVLAARGTGVAWTAIGRIRPALRVLALATAVALIASTQPRLEQRIRRDNRRQLETLSELARWTDVSDCVYDNAGSAVARPAAHFFFYTDVYLRASRSATLVDEVPRALVERGCVARVDDLRTDDLPEKLRQFLFEHYQPRTGDVALWGQRFDAPTGTFTAVKDGRYFVDPPLDEPTNTLWIDGTKVEGHSIMLRRGVYSVRLEGEQRPFHLLWLPRDGATWTPSRGPRTLSVLF